MVTPPLRIGTLPVVCYLVITESHRPTRATRHYVADGLMGSANALAICRGEGGFYLFYCDAKWEVVADTFHDSVDDAIEQAAFEYAGAAEGWHYVA